METLLMWVGGISGLITLAATLWRRTNRKPKAAGDRVGFRYMLTPAGFQRFQQWEVLLNLLNAGAHGWPPAQKDELRQVLERLTSKGYLRAIMEDYHNLPSGEELPHNMDELAHRIDKFLHEVERQAGIPSDTKLRSKERPRTAARATSTIGPKTARPIEPPRAYRHLLRHLPSELRSHRKEMEDFVEDGIRDRTRAGKSTRSFVLSETMQLALFIGKVTIFKFRKSHRKTVS